MGTLRAQLISSSAAAACRAGRLRVPYSQAGVIASLRIMLYHIEPSPPTWGTKLLDLVYPPRCVGCHRWGSWLCDACVEAIPALVPPLCKRCGTPLDAGTLCRTCRHTHSYCDGIRSAAPHVSPLRDAVHALKYEGMHVLVDPLAQILAQCWQAWQRESAKAPNVSAILAVPLHPARVRRRGYNQSALLARALAQRIDVPYREDWLVRVQNTPSQVGLQPQERWGNVRRAFRCRQNAVAGMSLLLVDDVTM